MNRKLLWSTATLLFWVAASPSVYAACNPNRWLIGPFTLTQSNGFTVEVHVFGTTASGRVHGNADYYPTADRGQPWVHGDELHNGQIIDNHLHFFVTWKDGNVGEYDADIDSSGKLINGNTFDGAHPDSTATWTSDVTLECWQQ